MGEAVAIILRYIDDDWQIQQRLVRLQLLAKSVCTGQGFIVELVLASCEPTFLVLFCLFHEVQF